ncbi:MAG: hypothetical protein U0M06_04350 [Clostridia bacterium]|nr:hypothetical protein [Clostridia bacterium]
MRLLVFLKDYPPNPSPNGHLAQMLLSELKQQHPDIGIDVITARIDINLKAKDIEPTGINILRIPTKYEQYSELSKQNNLEKNIFKKLIVKIYLRFTRSYVDKHYQDKYRHLPIRAAFLKAKKMHKENPYDVVLSVSHQFEAHFPALSFKKTFPSTRWIAYMMDPYADHASQTTRRKAIKREHKVFRNADCILTTEPMVTKAVYSPLPDYIKKIYTAYGNSLYDRTNTNIDNFDSKIINVVFSGQCPPTRNPEYLFKMWKYMPENLVLHIYAGGDSQIIQKAKELASETPNMIFHGYVPYDDLEKAHMEADIFANVGWFVNTMIPSKIFDYMSFGKPIFNLYTIDEDTTKPFLDMYPCGLSLKTDKNAIRENARLVADFCMKNRFTRIPYNEVSDSMGEFNLESVTDRFYRMMTNSLNTEQIQHFDCFS